MDIDQIMYRLASCREHKDLTQETVSNLLHVSPKHISDIETGRRRPSIDLFIQLIELYELDLNYLFYNLRSDDLEK